MIRQNSVFASGRQKHKITSTDITVYGIKVMVADNIKYVGMWLDTSLTMRKQVSAVCSKVSRNITLFRRNRKYLEQNCRFIEDKLSSTTVDFIT